MKYFDSMQNIEIKDPNRGMGQVGEPFTIYVPSSVLSEVVDTYEVDAQFGPWIHRSVLALGFTQSEVLPQGFTDKANKVAESINSAYDDAVDQAENNVMRYITDNLSYWQDEGIPQDKDDKLGEIVPMLSDSRRAMATSVVDGLEVQTND